MVSENPVIIGDVEKFSIVDFPNQIAAVAFLQGCPWRCPFCYNLSLQKIGGQPESDWTFTKFINFLEKRRGVLDAVVFSGGEPLAQDGLPEAIETVKAMGYKIGLHTGGYRPKKLEQVISALDWCGLDIKAPLTPERYQQATGGFNRVENVIRSLEILIRSGITFECRTTCDPRILTIDDLYEMAQFLKNAGVKEYYLQKYRPVTTDTKTSEEMCSGLIENQELLAYLKTSFDVFEVRK